ncbi:hypothetical protein HPB47_018943, partial [Ixodes persulcatus]
SPSSVAALDRRLFSITPPHCVTRLPRSLATRSNWKASEWRHWLLYYCLPCTLGILHPRYWSHLAKLVEGVHLLLREELTSSSIDRADALLRTFVASTATLYKDQAMTFNIHQMLHLAEAARQMGPLWGHSAFVFESGNGRLVKLVTGANGVPSQIVERVFMSQQLDSFLASPLVPDSCKVVCHRMLGYPKLVNFVSIAEQAQHFGVKSARTTAGSERQGGGGDRLSRQGVALEMLNVIAVVSGIHDGETALRRASVE